MMLGPIHPLMPRQVRLAPQCQFGISVPHDSALEGHHGHHGHHGQRVAVEFRLNHAEGLAQPGILTFIFNYVVK